MRIRFTESGGYAGLIRGADIDASGLPPTEARALGALLERAATSGTGGPGRGRDLATFQLRVTPDDSDTAPDTWEFDDQTVPEEAAPLVAYLRREARPETPDD